MSQIVLRNVKIIDGIGAAPFAGEVLIEGNPATAEGRLFDAAGRLYSHGTTTCMMLDA